jgi:hypothetical protein
MKVSTAGSASSYLALTKLAVPYLPVEPQLLYLMFETGALVSKTNAPSNAVPRMPQSPKHTMAWSLKRTIKYALKR